MASKPRFELPPQYSPHDVERRLYQRWLDSGVFTGHADSPKEPYVIVIPPPNVTAGGPMGDGVNHAIHDGPHHLQGVRGRGADRHPGAGAAAVIPNRDFGRVLATEGGGRPSAR